MGNSSHYCSVEGHGLMSTDPGTKLVGKQVSGIQKVTEGRNIKFIGTHIEEDRTPNNLLLLVLRDFW